MTILLHLGEISYLALLSNRPGQLSFTKGITKISKSRNLMRSPVHM